MFGSSTHMLHLTCSGEIFREMSVIVLIYKGGYALGNHTCKCVNGVECRVATRKVMHKEKKK